ncbi:MAG TPA: phosphopyruvate hydratase, partial [bacterium]|nr:phosphopyruvate hydratase [bacterium]
MYKIKTIKGREILDSRGNPTIEVELELYSGAVGVFSVPSGASTGKYEALELRDNDENRYNGKGVLKAIDNINIVINDELKDREFKSQEWLDNLLIEIDGTKDKSNLGANAILGVSCAFARACAEEDNIELYEEINNIYKRLGGKKNTSLPTPSFNILNGGKHGDNGIDFQEFMILPNGVNGLSEQVRCGAEIFHSLRSIIKNHNLSVGVGDEGGFSPNLKSNIEALEIIQEAIEETNWKLGKDVNIAIDVAS